MKKQSIRIILPLLLVVSLFVLCVFPSETSAPVSADTIATQKSQLNALKDKYNQATTKTKQVKNQLSKTQGQIKTNLEKKDDLDTEIVALTEQLKTAEFLIAEYESTISEKENEKAALEKKREEQHATLGEMIALSYKYGDESYIDLILGSKDISDFMQRMDFISYHMRYSKTLIDEMESTSLNIEEVSTALESSLSAMEDLKSELEETKSELEVKLTEVDSIILQLQADESYISTQLEVEEKDTAALEADILSLEKQIKAKEDEERKRLEEEAKKNSQSNNKTTANSGTSNNNTQPIAGNGDSGFIWPLTGYRPRTSSYGYRKDPFTGKTAFHNGLDISAPAGTNIYAAKSGTVIRASRYDTYGECVMIDHGGGVITLYAHCSGYNVKVGQQVKQGDVIAFVGSTGRSTGNHLHFVVRINGQYKDPNNYLP